MIARGVRRTPISLSNVAQDAIRRIARPRSQRTPRCGRLSGCTPPSRKPWSAMLRARFWPITPSPISPDLRLTCHPRAPCCSRTRCRTGTARGQSRPFRENADDRPCGFRFGFRVRLLGGRRRASSTSRTTPLRRGDPRVFPFPALRLHRGPPDYRYLQHALRGGYRRPLRFDEPFAVEVALGRSPHQPDFAPAIWAEGEIEPRATGEVVWVHADQATMRAVPLPAERSSF